jgi:hypothetical protein
MAIHDLDLIREQLTDLRVIAGETNANVGHIAQHIAALAGRLEEHSERISESAADIARWKALEIDAVATKTAKVVSDWQSKANLVIGVTTFVGVGGFASMLALLIKEFSK